MSQEIIIEWLAKQRKKNNKYFEISEIIKGVKDQMVERVVYRKITKLYAFGCLDIKFVKNAGWGKGWHPTYRLNQKSFDTLNVSDAK